MKSNTPTFSRHAAVALLFSILLPAALRAESPALSVLKDLAYRTGSEAVGYAGERCRLDLYLPTGQKEFPTLVWLHGGALQEGVKSDPSVVAVARHFAAAGIAVAAVNYRLSPVAPYPAYLEDTAAAFAWVKQGIAAHGGNPSRVFLGGHSAGGYLALMVGLDPAWLEPHGLKLSGIAGLVPVAGQTLTHYSIRQERGLPRDRIVADAAAPLHHAGKHAPPLLLLYAENDMAMRREENELLAAAMRAAGHRATTILMIPGRDHGSVGNDLAKPGDAGFEAVCAFILKPVPAGP